MATSVASDNSSISTVVGSRDLAADYLAIVNFYRQWFSVDYTPPGGGGRITASDFNAMRSAILAGAGSSWSISTFPGEVTANSRIVATTWGAPVKNNVTLDLTVPSGAYTYDIRAALVSAGWDQTTTLIATITNPSGNIIGSTQPVSPSLLIQGSFPEGSEISIINDGYIVGCGGAGGGQSAAGQAGGTAIYAAPTGSPIVKITNNGTIGGGGGGGGGPVWLVGGAGGGAGHNAGAGGYGYQNSGAAGSLTNGGNGGLNYGYAGGAPGCAGASGSGTGWGGGGGGLGAPGGHGDSGGAGGNGGAAVIGDSHLTWIVTGARYGAIS